MPAHAASSSYWASQQRPGYHDPQLISVMTPVSFTGITITKNAANLGVAQHLQLQTRPLANTNIALLSQAAEQCRKASCTEAVLHEAVMLLTAARQAVALADYSRNCLFITTGAARFVLMIGAHPWLGVPAASLKLLRATADSVLHKLREWTQVKGSKSNDTMILLVGWRWPLSNARHGLAPTQTQILGWHDHCYTLTANPTFMPRHMHLHPSHAMSDLMHAMRSGDHNLCVYDAEKACM